MWRKAATTRTNRGTGVVKIKRDGYATVNGFSKKNAWWTIRKIVWDRDRGLCQYHLIRLKQAIKGTEVHHIIPLSKGGTTTKANLVTLCSDCHEKRHHHLFRSRSI